VSTSLFDFLFRTSERKAARSALASACAAHELSTVITQATAESLQQEVKRNESVRRQLSAEIVKAKEHDSGERAAVVVKKECRSCVFFQSTNCVSGHCTHQKVNKTVQITSTCEFWQEKPSGQ